MNTIRLLVVGLLLTTAVVFAAPEASAAACNPHVTGIYEIDSVEYRACTTGLSAVNTLCAKLGYGPCIL